MSETLKRILSAAVLVAIVLAALNLGESYYWGAAYALLLGASILGLLEFYHLSDRGVEGRPVRFLGILFTVIFSAVFYARLLADQQYFVIDSFPETLRFLAMLGKDSDFLFFAVFLFIFSSFTYQMMFRPIDGSIFSIASTFTGVMYTAVPFFHFLLFFGMQNGIYYIVYIIVATTITDAGAYFAGKFLGKHKANLRVSPRKTYEGYIGGLISSVLSSLLFVFIWEKMFQESVFSYAEAGILAAFLSVISVSGDLVESTLKRDANKKDSASLIPGHGGMLDLADALFFTMPAGYYYLYLKTIAGFSI